MPRRFHTCASGLWHRDRLCGARAPAAAGEKASMCAITAASTLRQTDVLNFIWFYSMREKLRCGAMHFKTTASCAMLFRESTAMLVKPTMGHSLQGHPKLKLPLVGSVRPLEERPEA